MQSSENSMSVGTEEEVSQSTMAYTSYFPEKVMGLSSNFLNTTKPFPELNPCLAAHSLSFKCTNVYFSATFPCWATSKKVQCSLDEASPKKASTNLLSSAFCLSQSQVTSVEGGPTFLRIQLTISFSVLPPLYSILFPFLQEKLQLIRLNL